MDKEKITAHFGADFYTKVVNDLEKYAELWGLSDFEQIDYYSINCIFKCVSEKYGLCVLKIGNPSKEPGTEYHILKEYNGRGFCKVYEADTANGILLIERTIPVYSCVRNLTLTGVLMYFSVCVTDFTSKPPIRRVIRHIWSGSATSQSVCENIKNINIYTKKC